MNSLQYAGYSCFGLTFRKFSQVKRLFFILHWLNLDTAIGAGITSLFVAKYLAVTVPAIAVATLVLVVLAIYNFDHLIDARQIRGIAQSRRHRFYQLNSKVLSYYQVLLLLALLVLSWFVPHPIAKAGVILGAIALIYFLLLFIVLPKRFLFKEVLIAAVFVSGMFLAPVATNISLISYALPLWGQLFLLALANTLIFAWYDYELDMQEGHSSVAQILGRKNTFNVSIFILGVLLLSSFWQLFAASRSLVYPFVILAMGLILTFNLIFNKYTCKNEIFRLAGDAIFFVPLVGLLC